MKKRHVSLEAVHTHTHTIHLGKLRKKFKSESGSITIYVLAAMLFMLIVTISIYINKANDVNTEISKIKQIEDEYNSNLNLDEEYNKGNRYEIKYKKNYAQTEDFKYSDITIERYKETVLIETIEATAENTKIEEIPKTETPIVENIESIKNPIRYKVWVDCGEETYELVLYKRGWYHIWKKDYETGDQSVWYYHLGDGKFPTPYEEIELPLHMDPNKKSTYLFDEEGRLLIDWIKDDKGWKYAVAVDLKEEEGNIFYDSINFPINMAELEEKGFIHGAIVKSTFLKLTPSNNWYYIGDDKYMKTGWQQINGNWYYFNQSGSLLTGLHKIDNKWYYLNETGETGIANEIRIGSLGIMQGTGWIKQSDGTWVYIDENRNLYTEWREIDGYWYYFESDGRMATEWKEISGYWYYLGTNGKMTTGWQQVNGKWYYLKPNDSFTAWSGPVGSMLKNITVKIDGTSYTFDSSGAMV